jgi:hypothetical protein
MTKDVEVGDRFSGVGQTTLRRLRGAYEGDRWLLHISNVKPGSESVWSRTS